MNSLIGRKRRRRIKRFIKLAVLILIVGGVGTFIYNQFFVQEPSVKSATVSNVQSTEQPKKPLEKAVLDGLDGTKGSYAIVVKNLKTQEGVAINEHQYYQTGSLYKLWIMVTVFNQIENGQLKDEDPLVADVEELNNEFGIPEEAAELTEGEINFTIGSALNQMITISHNYAALALTKKIKLSTVANFLEKNHFQESKVSGDKDPPTATAADISLFLERLYKGELANPDNTKKMLDMLKAQKLNSKLPQYLPEDVEIAHKTGEIDMFSHDAGIVYTPKGDYIIVILSETESPAGANDRIGQVSKAVYEYFMKGGE